MFIMKKSDIGSQGLTFDIRTTRLVGIHMNAIKGIGSINVLHGNFSDIDTFELVKEVELDVASIETRNVVMAIKDAPTKWCRFELVSDDPTFAVKIEVTFK